MPAPELLTILQHPSCIFLSCLFCFGVRNFDSNPCVTMSCDCENMTTSQPISSFVNDGYNSHLTGFVGIRTERGSEYYSGWHILHMCFENDVRFLSLFSSPDPQCQKGHRMSHFFSQLNVYLEMAACSLYSFRSSYHTSRSVKWNI